MDTTPASMQFVAIVDDDANLCAACASLSRSAELAAEMFLSAEEFVQQARSEKIRCLVLDLGLPGMGGLELLVLLGASGWRMPIVCVTGHPDPCRRLAARALEFGAQAVLYKPFDSEELLKLLQANVDRHKGGSNIEPTKHAASVKRRS